MKKTDELRTIRIDPLVTPAELAQRHVITPSIMDTVISTRKNIANIMTGLDPRLLVIIGPCSVHDPVAAVEYAGRLQVLRKKYESRLEIVMRTYFEKPRTVIGWKGLISDPDLNGSFHVNNGLSIARKLLLDINKLGVPAATEFLDMVIGQFIADLISWGAIGARTTESQIHREMASALSCPVGFKNGTDGNIRIAVDAIRAASVEHLFLAPNKYGQMTINYTSGNPFGHVIMRGGKSPNYHAKDIAIAIKYLHEFTLSEYLMIDFSHGNCLKQHRRQLDVGESIAKQIRDGSTAIFGVMIESFLEEGSQKVIDNKSLVYGKSITDPCLGWNDSAFLLEKLANAVDSRF
ncbi:phospho-2-dehydro-3-deoxyheptonate aldolase [Buchnera aphidicola str. Bp (Baizongia pistaciae)]|uniref:Phospho-2-dehydro-3-deoxyheptonate aldolase, Trp-sensitive n=1 Tax=Buchnera aphidicola subsp. Baizongia pistaciae (strain Bp) TaxID=224915 RepID=AROH_BUCBP|nr:3-deoxy-7-phosphoheptulonate synthase [Buchnera aphidicola]Q89AW0.1 RecName: Full=Phospho-2-dehydro-3-deoxyheptonate aldolase, Trp-sensitive; AltName: Full=3-deoxy-D-arabino-heptulosonate 7-phosphate synthase; AltName: Full=DAHP synthase; AltName: Full=Phospho-2-keto-3-deoxyheptonate aldolase [Buchnera aphidicola str. Bp (Baizongia pistaciae)]AAO26852.1 phospho-2-dehydro-3-deoxyheptonate aldolase [Buchnera aphidicola str. Bp (Baizongia pistaciae)]